MDTGCISFIFFSPDKSVVFIKTVTLIPDDKMRQEVCYAAEQEQHEKNEYNYRC